MNPKTASLLADPHPNCHIVFPCVNDERITEAISTFALAGLRNGEGVVLVLTPEHAAALERSIAGEGFDAARFKADGLLTMLDARELLSRLLVDSAPNPLVFNDTIGSMITTAKLNAPSGRVRLFG